ncbi:hypothetical protein Tco_0824773 [Tanacetum coccineum]|uniref:Gag protein n=1 Tax=Tanacetum coccineum TaxID=301880 RepID=A0ABQ5ANH0_9ASTR
MHNNIMAAGSKDRPPMLGPGRYSQWHSRFLRYLDTKSNGEYLRKCIFEGPYTPTSVLIAAVAVPCNRGFLQQFLNKQQRDSNASEMWEAIERQQQVATMQVNVQFFSTSTRMSRFVHNCEQQHKLDEVSYHKLFDILKQYQKEVNELRAERMAKNANPLALAATAQTLQDPYYQSSKSHKSYAPTSKASHFNQSQQLQETKGKEIAKPITHQLISF